jgi:hypothetical protein
VGPLLSAFSSVRKGGVLVGTEAGALALLSQRSGDISWRVSLPDNEELLAALPTPVGTDTVIPGFVSLSSNGINDEKRDESEPLIGHVRFWSAESGALMWETHITSENYTEARLFSTLSLGGGKKLIALFNGDAFIFDTTSGLLLKTVPKAEEKGIVYPVNAADVTADGKHVVVSMADHDTFSLCVYVGNDSDISTKEGAAGVSHRILGLSSKKIAYDNTVLAVFSPEGISPTPASVSVIALGKREGAVHVACSLSESATVQYHELVLASKPNGVAIVSIQKLEDIASVSGGDAILASIEFSDGSKTILSISKPASTLSTCSAWVSIVEEHSVSSSSSSVVVGATSLGADQLSANSAVVSVLPTSKGSLSLSITFSHPTSSITLADVSSDDWKKVSSVHGGVVKAFPFRVSAASKETSTEANSWRFLLALEDGAMVMVQSSSLSSVILWNKAEGDACVVQAVPFDASTHHHVSTNSGSGTITRRSHSLIDEDPELSFQARIRYQIEGFRNFAASIGPSLSRLGQQLASDPVGVITGSNRKGRAAEPGKMAPSLQQSTEKLYVIRTRLDGNSPIQTCAGSTRKSDRGSSRKRVLGSLAAVRAESGDIAWRRSLRSAAGGSTEDDVVYMFQSRPRPFSSFSPELFLAECGYLGRLEGGPPMYNVSLTWINAETGVDQGFSAYVSSSPLVRVYQTPVLHAPLERHTFALEHADGSVVIAPGPEDVVESLKNLGPDFSITSISYDPKADIEGLSGSILGSFQTNQAFSSSELEVITTRAHLFPLWQSKLAGLGGCETSSSDGCDKILAVASGGGTRGPGIDSMAEKTSLSMEEFTRKLGDSPHARGVQVLGDDSLLLKYTSPHVIAVAVGKPGAVSTPFERSRNQQRSLARSLQGLQPTKNQFSPMTSTPSTANSTLTIYLFDGVSGRLLNTRRHSGATGPIHMQENDNWLIYTYWNSQARRPELASAVLYEGAVDTYQLTPWAKKNPQLTQRTSSVSSTSGSTVPIVAFKTFILPVTVKGFSLTETLHGITPVHLLLMTESDGVMLLDRRLIDPRRPIAEPKEFEKIEGLIQYSPYLPMRHSWLLSHNTPILRLHSALSIPTSFESTMLVAAFGLDHFICRSSPMKAYDQLDPDFNYAFFIALLIGGVSLVLVLGYSAKEKDLVEAWR